MDDLESVSLGSGFENRGSPINSSLSFISVQSLSSARGSTPLTKRRRCYDATKPMESEYDAPIYRLRSLSGLQDCGLIRIGKKDTDTKTRHKIDEYFNNVPRSAANTTRPRKDFPCLRARSKTIASLRNKQLEQYFQKNISTRNGKGEGKSVTFTLPGAKRPNSESIVVKHPAIKVLQQNSEKSKTRPYPDKLLLRRPTTKSSVPLNVDSELFLSLDSSILLKPINFRTSNEQYKFYSKNYPLLLDANQEENPFYRKRTPTPEVSNSPEIPREIKLSTRLNRLETSLDTLDRETDDIDFRTVLRDDVFYPNRWPWNEKKSSDLVITPSPKAF